MLKYSLIIKLSVFLFLVTVGDRYKSGSPKQTDAGSDPWWNIRCQFPGELQNSPVLENTAKGNVWLYFSQFYLNAENSLYNQYYNFRLNDVWKKNSHNVRYMKSWFFLMLEFTNCILNLPCINIFKQ